jgi:hypothetical protein
MGGGSKARHYQGYFKDVFKWLEKDSQIIRVTEPGDYSLHPLETEDAVVAEIVRPEPGAPKIYLEYRQPIGFDSLPQAGETEALNGVFVNWINNPLESRLLDTDPEDGVDDLIDVTVLPGETFLEERSGIRITNDGKDENDDSLSISVEFVDLECTDDIEIGNVGYQILPEGDKEVFLPSVNSFRILVRENEEFMFRTQFRSTSEDFFKCIPNGNIANSQYKTQLEYSTKAPIGWLVNEAPANDRETLIDAWLKIPPGTSPGEYSILLTVTNPRTGNSKQKTVTVVILENNPSPIIERDFGGIKYEGTSRGTIRLSENKLATLFRGTYSFSTTAIIHALDNDVTQDEFYQWINDLRQVPRYEFTQNDDGIYCNGLENDVFLGCAWYSGNKIILISSQGYGEEGLSSFNEMVEEYRIAYLPSSDDNSINRKADSDDGNQFRRLLSSLFT